MVWPIGQKPNNEKIKKDGKIYLSSLRTKQEEKPKKNKKTATSEKEKHHNLGAETMLPNGN